MLCGFKRSTFNFSQVNFKKTWLHIYIVLSSWSHHRLLKITKCKEVNNVLVAAKDLATQGTRSSTGMISMTWWRHQMETFSALLAICTGNSPVPGEFPTQRPVTRSFDVYFDLRPDKRLSKQSWGWWFETLSHSLWRHRNDSHWWRPLCLFLPLPLPPPAIYLPS